MCPAVSMHIHMSPAVRVFTHIRIAVSLYQPGCQYVNISPAVSISSCQYMSPTVNINLY